MMTLMHDMRSIRTTIQKLGCVDLGTQGLSMLHLSKDLQHLPHNTGQRHLHNCMGIEYAAADYSVIQCELLYSIM